MQKGKTSKFVPKLGLVLWMLPLSSWAISGTIPEANSALTSYAHEAREIDAIAQSAKNEPSQVQLPMPQTELPSLEPTLW